MGVISTPTSSATSLGPSVRKLTSEVFGAAGTITAALVVIALSLAVVGFATGFWLALVAFSIAGFGSGAGNVATIGLVSHWFLRSVRVEGLRARRDRQWLRDHAHRRVHPTVNTQFGESGWRVNWWIIAAWSLSRPSSPHAASLTALRTGPHGSRASVKDAVLAEPIAHMSSVAPPSARAHLRPLRGQLLVYVTFIVTTLVDERGLHDSAAGWFWFPSGSCPSSPVRSSCALSDPPDARSGWRQCSACTRSPSSSSG